MFFAPLFWTQKERKGDTKKDLTARFSPPGREFPPCGVAARAISCYNGARKKGGGTMEAEFSERLKRLLVCDKEVIEV